MMTRHATHPAVLATFCTLMWSSPCFAQALPPELQGLNRQQQMSLLLGYASSAARICGFEVDRETLARIIVGYGITPEQTGQGGELGPYLDNGVRSAAETAGRQDRQAFCEEQWREMGPSAPQLRFFTSRAAR